MVPVLDRMTSKFGSVSGILDALETIGCRKKPQIILILMRVYWQGGMHRLVLESFNEMSANNYAPNLFARNVALDALFKTGGLKVALEFLEKTESPNFFTFRVAITNLCEVGDWLRAIKVLRIMTKGRFVPDHAIFTRILICLQKKGRFMELLQLAGFLIVSGKKISVSMWTILIDALCKLDRAECASQLLGKMVNYECSPNVITYTVVIKGLLEARLPEKAFYLLDVMLSKGLDLDMVLCNVLIDFLCKSKRYDDAIELIICLQEWNLKPDSYTLPSLMNLLCTYGQIELIPRFIDVLDISVDLVACNSLMHILCKAGFPSNAIDFYDDVVESGFMPDNYSYAALLSALCRSGRVDDAVRVYKGILLRGSFLDAHVHTIVFNGLIRGGQPHTAINLFRKAVRGNFGLDSVSFAALVYGMLRKRGLEEAYNLISEMRQLGWELSIPTYKMMIHEFLKRGKFLTVNRLVKAIIESGNEKK